MTLRNSLYTIRKQEQTTDGSLFTIQLHPKHIIYQDHFPEMPVTPGVCIIQIAMELMEELENKRLALTSVKNVKFLSVVNPYETPELSFAIHRVERNEGELKASFFVTHNDTMFAKLSLTFHGYDC